MSGVAVVSIAIGVALIVARGPFAVAPGAYTRPVRQWFQSASIVRAIGGGVLALGVAGISVTRQADDWLAGLIAVISYLFLLGGITLTAIPSFIQSLVESLLDAFDAPALRAIGILNIGFGVFFIWAGFSRGG